MDSAHDVASDLAPDFAPIDMAMDSAPDVPDAADLGPDLGPLPTICDGVTVDLNTNNAHCGECDNACDPAVGVCRGGSCTCYAPYEACGDENRCTWTDFDPAHCGICDRACGANEVCQERGCACSPGFMRCDGVCVDIDSNPAHCGQCNRSCNGGICREGDCRGGNSCGLTWYECGSGADGTACIRPEANPAYCNPTPFDECGNPCGAGEICSRDGLISPWACHTYRPAIGCTSCPCADCVDEYCIESNITSDAVFCVAN